MFARWNLTRNHLGRRGSWEKWRFSPAAVEKLTDQQGQPIWRPSLIPGTPSTLLGFPMFTTDAWPAYSAGNDIIEASLFVLNTRCQLLECNRTISRCVCEPITREQAENDQGHSNVVHFYLPV